MNVYSFDVPELGVRLTLSFPSELLGLLRLYYPARDSADMLAAQGTASLAVLAPNAERDKALTLLALCEGNADALNALSEACPAKMHVWARQWVLGTRVLADMFRTDLHPRTLRALASGLIERD